MRASEDALPRIEAAGALLPPGVTGASVVAPNAVESAVTTAAEPVEVVFDGVVLRVVLVVSLSGPEASRLPELHLQGRPGLSELTGRRRRTGLSRLSLGVICLLYTSDAADE